MDNSETEGSPLFGKPVESRKLIELAYFLVILTVFAWAKEFLLPLILAILISFVLAPAVSRLERWRFPGVIAILRNRFRSYCRTLFDAFDPGSGSCKLSAQVPR
jgi:hypothetical protein